MALKKTLLILFFLFIPTQVFAWGPLTHVYLGSEIFYFASLLPVGLYSLLKKYRQDFIYGNLMADAVIAKSYMPESTHCHNWNTALNIHGSAQTDSEHAFALGYMAHLAADTVAHGELTDGMGSLEHAKIETSVDSSLANRHWYSAMSIKGKVQRRNDCFLETIAPHSVVFSHGTNRRMFKGIVALSALNSAIGSKLKLFSTDQSRSNPDNIDRRMSPRINEMLVSSRERMLDVIINEDESSVLTMNPMAELKPLPFSQPLHANNR